VTVGPAPARASNSLLLDDVCGASYSAPVTNVATVTIRITRRQHAELALRKAVATVGRCALVAGAWLLDAAYPGSIQTKVEISAGPNDPEAEGT
jgi:hypothetical protein